MVSVKDTEVWKRMSAVHLAANSGIVLGELVPLMTAHTRALRLHLEPEWNNAEMTRLHVELCLSWKRQMDQGASRGDVGRD